MSGFNVGDLFSSLNLDDSQFREALDKSAASSAVFKIKLEDIGGSAANLYDQLYKAGFQLKEWQGWLNSLRAQGVGGAESVNVLTKSIEQLQARIANLRATDLQNLTKLGGGDGSFAKELAAITNRYNAESRLDSDAAARKKEMADREMGNLAAVSRMAQEAANERIRLANQIADAEQRLASERIKLANQVADGEKRMANDRVALANQAAEGEYRAAQIAIDAQRKIEAAERQRFIEHRRLMQESQALTTVGRDLAVGGGIGLAGSLFVAKDAADFQDAMTKSLAVIGPMSTALRDDLAQAARTAAKETGLAAKELAGDYAVMAKGGLTAAESLQQLGIFSKYAVANQVDVKDATKQVLTVMEALGLKTSDIGMITNELTRANQLARGSVEGLAQAMEGRGGVALRNAHVGLEEALAITVAFTKAGFSASEAQTAMSQAVNRLTAVARTHGDTQVWLNGKYTDFKNIVYDGSGNIRRMSDMLTDLNSTLQGRSAKSVGDLFDSIKMGTTRGVDGIKTLIAQAPLIDELTKTFQNAGGALDQAFNIQMLSPLKQLELLKVRITDVSISVGIAFVGALQGLAKALEPALALVQALATEFSKLPPWMQEFVASTTVIGSISAIAAGGILMMAGSAVRLAADLKLLSASGAISGLATVASGVAGIAAVALEASLALGFVYALYKNLSAASHESIDAMGKGMKVPEFQTNIGFGRNTDSLGDKLGRLSTTFKDSGEESGKNYGIGLIDNVRKSLDEMKALVKAQMSSIVDDPELFRKPGAGDKDRARLFSNLGLTDYQTQIKQLEIDLNDAMKAGLLNPAQIELARNGIQKLKDDFADLGLRVRDAMGPREATRTPGEIEFSSNKLIFQLDELKRARKEAEREAQNLLSDIRHGTVGTEAFMNVEPPELLNEAANNTQKAVDWTNKWNEKLAKTEDILNKIVKERDRLTDRNEVQDISKFMGFKLDENLGSQFSNAFARLQTLHTGNPVADIHNQQEAAVKLFEELARGSGETAEHMSQVSGIFINGIKADYDALRDQLSHSGGVIRTQFNGLMGDLQSIAMNTIGKLGGAIFDTLFPDFTNPKNSDPLKPLVDSFRSAFEQLSSYSDPKGALNNLVRSIQQAGSASQANAIAVKYFGNTAGPLLAAELRNGTISAKDLKAAIDAASASTLDYANKTSDSVSQLTLLWRQLVKDVVVSIIERLIGIGLISLLTWLGIVGKGTNTLASAMDQVFTKLAIKLGVLFKKLASDITLTVKATVKAVEDIINGMYATATVVIRTVYETVGSPGGYGGGGDGGYDPGSLFTGSGGFNIPDWYTNMVNNARGYGGGDGGGGDGGGYSNFPMPSNGELSIGHITVVSNDPREFVRKLKSLRAV